MALLHAHAHVPPVRVDPLAVPAADDGAAVGVQEQRHRVAGRAGGAVVQHAVDGGAHGAARPRLRKRGEGRQMEGMRGHSRGCEDLWKR